MSFLSGARVSRCMLCP
ncbi:MAG: hypothetical protein FJ152_07165 [Firmicutes bacterium]|nr:hypothetical protein [Bacillota bacterium]